MEQTSAPFARPLYLMAKPISSRCNLNCTYCYYLEKSNLYKEDNPRRVFTMTDEMLEHYIKVYLESQALPQAMFTWHGGEPLMRPVRESVVLLQMPSHRKFWVHPLSSRCCLI